MSAPHLFHTHLLWTGNRGEGTRDYRAYGRDHVISAPGKPVLVGSSHPDFRGDAARYNPEELLVAALSACHLLAYLHLCAEAGIVVTGYEDDAEGTMVLTPDGGGHFTDTVLRPRVTIAAGDAAQAERLHEAQRLHEQAHGKCFIAASVNFPVRCEPRVTVG